MLDHICSDGGNIEETSKFGVNILVFHQGDSPGKGKYCHRYSGDICPIDVSSVDEVEQQGSCLTVMDGAMSKMCVKDPCGKQKMISVWVNIIKNL